MSSHERKVCGHVRDLAFSSRAWWALALFLLLDDCAVPANNLLLLSGFLLLLRALFLRPGHKTSTRTRARAHIHGCEISNRRRSKRQAETKCPSLLCTSTPPQLTHHAHDPLSPASPPPRSCSRVHTSLYHPPHPSSPSVPSCFLRSSICFRNSRSSASLGSSGGEERLGAGAGG